jgi:hypothetical protein
LNALLNEQVDVEVLHEMQVIADLNFGLPPVLVVTGNERFDVRDGNGVFIIIVIL